MQLLSVSRLIAKSVLEVIRATNSPISIQTNTVRCLCSKHVKSSMSQESAQSSKNLAWKSIYFFPLINIARLLNRLKLYQSLFTVVALPTSLGLYYYDMSDITSVSVVTGSAAFTCFSLYIVTAFFKRLIGIIYIDEDKKYIKIAHLTFWGNRKNITVPIEDIIPLTDGNCNPSDAFVKIHRYSSEEVLYMTLRFGKILDKDNFQNVFGSFEILGFKK